jgi:hypothetical protein
MADIKRSGGWRRPRLAHEPGNPGVLVQHPPDAAHAMLRAATAGRLDRLLQPRALVEALADDGQ